MIEGDAQSHAMNKSIRADKQKKINRIQNLKK